MFQILKGAVAGAVIAVYGLCVTAIMFIPAVYLAGHLPVHPGWRAVATMVWLGCAGGAWVGAVARVVHGPR